MTPLPTRESAQIAADSTTSAPLPYRVELLCRDGSPAITSECKSAKQAAAIAEIYRDLHPRQAVRVTQP